MTQTRRDLAERIALRHGLPRRGPRGTQRMVTLVLEALSSALATGERVELRGVGSFRPAVVEAPQPPPGEEGPLDVVIYAAIRYRPSRMIRRSIRRAILEAEGRSA